MREPKTLYPPAIAAELVEIIAEVCNCAAMWSQHQGPITHREAVKLQRRIDEYMCQLVIDAPHTDIHAGNTRVSELKQTKTGEESKC